MKKILILLVVAFNISSCSNDDDSRPPVNCDLDNSIAIISAALFQNAPSDELMINSASINNDALTINFSASGCDGASWQVKLIDSENVFESNPPQRNLRLSLKNEEVCLALITQELTFDISNLQVMDANQVVLNITNSDESILVYYSTCFYQKQIVPCMTLNKEARSK